VLVRYLVDGSLDAGFGSRGQATANVAGPADFGNAVALQIDWKLGVAGQALVGGRYLFALLRLNAARTGRSTSHAARRTVRQAECSIRTTPMS
jgi:hypothetical protein